MKSSIQCYIPKKYTFFKEHKDVYEIKTKNRFLNWVIRFLLKHQLIKSYKEEMISYKSVTYDFKSIIDGIRELQDIIYYHTGLEPLKVMIGRKQAHMIDEEIWKTSRFNMPMEFNGPNGKRVIMGLEIIVNPFIDGVVLLNEEML